MIEKLIVLDTKLFLWLNSFHSPGWDKIMIFISGRTEWIPLYLALIGYIIWRYRFKSIAIIIAVILAVSLADQLAVKAFKEVFERLRPSHNPDISHLAHIVNGYKGGSFGFVSNHAANTFALATITSLVVRNKYYTAIIFLWAAIVSYSRIYLGVHYPGDIIGGALVGVLVAKIIHYGYSKLELYRLKRMKKYN